MASQDRHHRCLSTGALQFCRHSDSAGAFDEDEFRWLVESQKAAAEMEALRKANAGTMRIEKFRDSVLQIMVKTAVVAIVAAV
jgi:hypothetical protein